MRYEGLHKTCQDADCSATEQELAEDGIEHPAEGNTLEATEGCMLSPVGAHLQLSGVNFIVTDGPFAETKEMAAGYAFARADAKDRRKIEPSRNAEDHGASEIRQLFASNCGGESQG